MEARAIQLFTLFTTLTQLFRASDGEYFTELDDVQAYVANNLVAGAYTIVERTTPLPPVPTPQPEDTPIWVRINNPVLDAALRYDNVIGFTSDTLGTLGNRTYTTNNVGGFRPGNVVIAVGRNGTAVGLKKYGTVVSMAGNDLTINFTSFEGANGALSATQWDILLSGLQGIQGPTGATGPQGPGTQLMKLINTGGSYTVVTADANTTIVLGSGTSNLFSATMNGLAANTVLRFRNSRTSSTPAYISRTISSQNMQLPIYPGEEIEVIINANHTFQWKKVGANLGLNETFIQTGATFSFDQSDYEHRNKVTVIMTATGAKTVDFPLLEEVGREVEVINASPSGVITINLPAGHNWAGDLAGKTVTIANYAGETDALVETIARSARIWKIDNQTWFATR